MNKKILRTLAVLAVGFGQFAFSQGNADATACAAYRAIAKSFEAELKSFPTMNTDVATEMANRSNPRGNTREKCFDCVESLARTANVSCVKGADQTDKDHLAYIVDGNTYLRMCSNCVSELNTDAAGLCDKLPQ